VPIITVSTDYGDEVLKLETERGDFEKDQTKLGNVLGTVSFYIGVACSREHYHYEMREEEDE